VDGLGRRDRRRELVDRDRVALLQQETRSLGHELLPLGPVGRRCRAVEQVVDLLGCTLVDVARVGREDRAQHVRVRARQVVVVEVEVPGLLELGGLGDRDLLELEVHTDLRELLLDELERLGHLPERDRGGQPLTVLDPHAVGTLDPAGVVEELFRTVRVVRQVVRDVGPQRGRVRQHARRGLVLRGQQGSGDLLAVDALADRLPHCGVGGERSRLVGEEVEDDARVRPVREPEAVAVELRQVDRADGRGRVDLAREQAAGAHAGLGHELHGHGVEVRLTRVVVGLGGPVVAGDLLEHDLLVERVRLHRERPGAHELPGAPVLDAESGGRRREQTEREGRGRLEELSAGG
jgi:hypothetical protein